MTESCECIIKDGKVESLCELHQKHFNTGNPEIEELNYITPDNFSQGSLIIGKMYRIEQYNVDDDFENVGHDGVNSTFTATGTTPNDWSHGSLLRQIGMVPIPVKWNDDFESSQMGTVSNKSIPTPRIEVSFKKTIDDLIKRVEKLEKKSS